MQLNDATLRQNQAASPEASTWLSANAGSGKTRVLIDRVARLLLGKVPPQNILCLTYTKAAASEMQNRLFERLGKWSMMPDGELAQDLQGMGEAHVISPDRLAEARRLFAQAIEAPGGLRIQTIHSFCASLLRRFPLEAGVSPGFHEMDDRAAELMREEVIETLAAGPDVGAIDAVARYVTDESVASLARAVVEHRQSLARPLAPADVYGWFGVPHDITTEALLASAWCGGEGDLMADLLRHMARSDSNSDRKTAESLAGLDWDMPSADAFEAAMSAFLYGEKAKSPFAAKIEAFPTKGCRAELGPLCDDLNDFMQRVADARPHYVGLCAAERTLTLSRFAVPFLRDYERHKAAQGLVDFDDLIDKTRQLLSDPAVADWVLFKLDGGIDHILVDEAQDTSPSQWQVIERLAHEFAAGRGARADVPRTIFVVGDKKQSIYSFQGADPEGFDRMRDLFDTRQRQADLAFQSLTLEYSFRSSAAVLETVDRVFTEVAHASMPMDARHRAFHDALPGRVDLWPVVPAAEKAEKAQWFDPVDILSSTHHDVQLADHLACFIKNTVGSGTIPSSNGTRRPIRAGDFLILVRKRSTLFSEIIRACKAHGVPIAGADRLKLGGELAVRDLAATLAFLATPEDDLALACALKSPLFGWSEAQLYDLAANRPQTYLWPALRERRTDFPDTLSILDDIRDQADFLRPFDLVERILTRHDGRRKLLARLGPEAEDGIDQLLGQALAYERREVPSLTGFLAWLETDEVEVKRQLDDAGDQVRVMTVHGAKGLESPIVILPDTTQTRDGIRDEVIALDNSRTIWKTPAHLQPAAMQAALTRMKQAEAAERLRLLYVAMTRAETWLIVAGAGKIGRAAETWHDAVREALEGLKADPLATPTGPGLRHQRGDWNGGLLVEPEPCPQVPIDQPAWVETPVDVPAPTRAISPSDLGGAKAIGQDVVDVDLESSLRRGRQIHLLLEHLPGIPRDMRRSIATSLLTTSADPATEPEQAELLAEAEAVLDAPELAWLFDPTVLSEVDVTANLPVHQDARLHGTIDKLIVDETRILAVDFKSNWLVPDHPEQVPVGVLRQMAAYHSALSRIYPGRTVETAILWTRVARLMPLPHEIVRAALQSIATS